MPVSPGPIRHVKQLPPETAGVAPYRYAGTDRFITYKEYTMKTAILPHGVIGIDMDSTSFDWYFARTGSEKDSWGRCMTTKRGLQEFATVHSKLGKPVIALEGFHGQNLVLEKWLRSQEIPFYSIPPYNVAKYREAHISRNKNNKYDAHAVASFAINQIVQGDITKFQNYFVADYNIRPLTRRYHQLSALITSEYSNLWKYIKLASSDVYVALKGQHPDFHFSSTVLHTMGMLHLFAGEPDIAKWATLSSSTLIELMGGKRFVGRETLITSLKKLSHDSESVPMGLQETIRQIASNLVKFRQDRKHIGHTLERIAFSDPMLTALLQERGIGIVIASSIVSEVITIARFKNDDRLASYAGLGRTENKSGTGSSMRRSLNYNRYLKDAIITAAVQHVTKNPKSALSDYYHLKLKQGHSKFYARRALARALLRRIFKILKTVEGKG